jgi:hypothetical protein
MSGVEKSHYSIRLIKGIKDDLFIVAEIPYKLQWYFIHVKPSVG